MNVHSVRLPMLGAAYYPEAWDESEQAHDIAMMQKAGITVVRIGEFAWHNMEPREGEFDFSWLHRCLDRLEAAGIRVILGTPSACPPIWLEEKHPEMRLIDDTDQRHQHGGRRHCCSNNPDYLYYSVRIAEKMVNEFGYHPNVIGWQIDNEIAAFEYGCYCPHCVREFQNHLRSRYGTIENLNKRWNLNLFSQAYDDFSQVPQPRENTGQRISVIPTQEVRKAPDSFRNPVLFMKASYLPLFLKSSSIFLFQPAAIGREARKSHTVSQTAS